MKATRPLSELDMVDWASLQHAYGVASDTPGLLRRLDAGDEHAQFDVWSFLCHQGTVYSATAAAIPFILDMVARGRGELLPLLNMMAHGQGYHLVHERNPVRRASAEMQAIMRMEQSWIDAARRAVKHDADLYRPYLKDGEAEVRADAARLLTLCAEHRADILGWLAEALAKEEDAAVRAAMLKSSYDEGNSAELFHFLPADLAPEKLTRIGSPSLRFWLATLTVQQAGRQAGEAVQTLLDSVAVDEWYDDLSADNTVSELLVPLGLRDEVAAAIMRRDDIFLDPYAFLNLFQAELPWRPQLLHPILRQWLERYSEQKAVLVSLNDYGLPTFPDELRQWLQAT